MALTYKDIATVDQVQALSPDVKLFINESGILKQATLPSLSDALHINDVSALHFKGLLQTLPTDLSEYCNGDMVIVGSKEYVLYEQLWYELGDTTDVQTGINDLESHISSIEDRVSAIEDSPYSTERFVENAVSVQRNEIADADYATESYVNTAVNKIDLSPLATKTYVDQEIDALPFQDYATKDALASAVDSLNIDDYAKKSDLSSYATDAELNSAIANIDLSDYIKTVNGLIPDDDGNIELSLSLEGNMRVAGELDTLPSTTSGYVNGDVVFVNAVEYVCYNNEWRELGNDDSLSAAHERISNIGDTVYYLQNFVGYSTPNFNESLLSRIEELENQIDSFEGTSSLINFADFCTSMPTNMEAYNPYDVICCNGMFYMLYNNAWYPFDTTADLRSIVEELQSKSYVTSVNGIVPDSTGNVKIDAVENQSSEDVFVTYGVDVATANHNSAEIFSAYKEHKACFFVDIFQMTYTLSSASNDRVEFYQLTYEHGTGISIHWVIVYNDYSVGTVSYSPATTPNPYALSFVGAVNASYDGSSALKIEIPDTKSFVKSINGISPDSNGNVEIATAEATGLILASSTSGSSKRFLITVDDSGVLSATEITV